MIRDMHLFEVKSPKESKYPWDYFKKTGTLPGDQVKLLEWHLEGCRPCIAFVNTYRGTITAASRLKDVELPPELKKRLLAFLKQAQPR